MEGIKVCMKYSKQVKRSGYKVLIDREDKYYTIINTLKDKDEEGFYLNEIYYADKDSNGFHAFNELEDARQYKESIENLNLDDNINGQLVIKNIKGYRIRVEGFQRNSFETHEELFKKPEPKDEEDYNTFTCGKMIIMAGKPNRLTARQIRQIPDNWSIKHGIAGKDYWFSNGGPLIHFYYHQWEWFFHTYSPKGVELHVGGGYENIYKGWNKVLKVMEQYNEQDNGRLKEIEQEYLENETVIGGNRNDKI